MIRGGPQLALGDEFVTDELLPMAGRFASVEVGQVSGVLPGWEWLCHAQPGVS